MKFVPLSDWMYSMGPCMDRRHLKALMKLDVDIDSIISRWTALVHRQAKMTAHLLLSRAPPRIRWVTLLQGPKTFSPMWVKGGSVVSLSEVQKMSDLPSNVPLSFLQVTNLNIMLQINLFPPTIQTQAMRNAPSVKWRPWWATFS